MTKHTTGEKRGFKAKPALSPGDAPVTPPQTPSLELFYISLRLLRWQLVPIIILTVLPGLLSMLGTAMIGDIIKPDVTDPLVVIGILLRLVAGLWQLASYGALLYFVLSTIGGKPLPLGTCYRRGIRLLPKLLLLFITLLFIFAAGLALFIAPGLIWIRRYFLSPYFMVDEGLGIKDALVTSSLATKPVKRHVWTMLAILLIIAVPAFGSSYIPIVGAALTIVLSVFLVFLPALRYQEISSDIRGGSLAMDQASRR